MSFALSSNRKNPHGLASGSSTRFENTASRLSVPDTLAVSHSTRAGCSGGTKRYSRSFRASSAKARQSAFPGLRASTRPSSSSASLTCAAGLREIEADEPWMLHNETRQLGPVNDADRELACAQPISCCRREGPTSYKEPSRPRIRREHCRKLA